MIKCVSVDDNPMGEAQRLSGHRSKRATVQAALEEYIRLKERQRSELEDQAHLDPHSNAAKPSK